jgi:von Willebrand factor type A domain
MKRALLAALVLAVALGEPSAAQWRPGGVMRIVLLVDSSSSVAPMVTPIRAGLNVFLDGLAEETEVVFISTGGQIRIRVPPTTDRTVLRDAVNRFAADGGANSFVDTLLESDQRFLRKAPDRRPVFVILTTDAGIGVADVRIDAYNKFAGDFVTRGGRAHAIVVRGLNSGSTTMISENLTHNTGGYYETINVASAIPKTMKTLSEYLAADQ